MTTPESLMKEIAGVDEQLSSLNDHRRQLLQRWAELVCPLKVGEQTTCKGYSHTGKPCVVERIRSLRVYRGYRWEVVVRILNKDGSPSKNTSDFDQDQFDA